MLKYIIGWLKNFLNPAVSVFALIDNYSVVSSKAKIYRGAKVFNSQIGSYTYLTKGSSVVYAEVGKFCSIGHGSNIGLAHHTLDKLSTSPIFTERNNATSHHWVSKSTEYPYKKVIIGNDVWIGSRVMVMGGVKIGDGAVIAAGSIVTKDVPSYAVVGGVPAKILKYRFDENIIAELLEIKWWNLPEDLLKNSIEIFQQNNLNANDIGNKFRRF